MTESQTTAETGWLIETTHIDGTPWWLMPCSFSVPDEEGDVWTKDSLKAVRFARKEDAENVILEVGWTSPPAIATEHQWG